jgi:hypothetical protein
MAELIPFEYRLRIVQRQRLGRWLGVAAIVGAVSLTAVGAAFAWSRQCASGLETLSTQYREKSALIVRSQLLRASRQNLANRMEKIQQLMDDRTLLSLLRNISSGFSAHDCLEYINIDARAEKDPAHAAGASGKGFYVVHITGITESSASLADLMTRLGRNGSPPINVVLQSSKREPLLDGKVMRFEILCEQPENKGS